MYPFQIELNLAASLDVDHGVATSGGDAPRGWWGRYQQIGE